MKTKQNENKNVWIKIRNVFVWGIVISCGMTALMFLPHYGIEDAPQPTEVLVSLVVFFVGGAYMGLISETRSSEHLRGLNKGREREKIQFFLGLSLIVLWGIRFVTVEIFEKRFSIVLPIISHVMNFIFPFFIVPLLLFIAGIYALVISLSGAQYLSVIEAKTDDKRRIANALSIFIPLFGLPWVFEIIMFFKLIGIQLDWISYITIAVMYAIFFFLFIDLPFYVSTNTKRKHELNQLERKKNLVLEKLKCIQNDKADSVLLKIAYELEIARIEREQEETKSVSAHPYKVVHSLSSFFLGVLAALLIQFVQKLLGI